MKSALEAMSLVGWPEAWGAEPGTFEAAVEAWSLAQQVWETKLGLTGRPALTQFQYAMNCYGVHGDKLKALGELVAERTGDRSAADALDAILRRSANGPSIMADQAIQWCFGSASLAFDRSRDGLRAKLRK